MKKVVLPAFETERGVWLPSARLTWPDSARTVYDDLLSDLGKPESLHGTCGWFVKNLSPDDILSELEAAFDGVELTTHEVTLSLDDSVVILSVSETANDSLLQIMPMIRPSDQDIHSILRRFSASFAHESLLGYGTLYSSADSVQGFADTATELFELELERAGVKVCKELIEDEGGCSND